MRHDRARLFAWFSGSTVVVMMGMAVFGFGLAAQAADGEILFPGIKFIGKFDHEANDHAAPSIAFGQVTYGGWGTAMILKARLQQGGYISISVYDSLPNLLKVPHTYPLFTDGTAHEEVTTAYAEVRISLPGSCRLNTKAKSTLTLTALGGVDGVISGTLSGMRWKGDDPEACAKIGETGSFKVQRAVDYHQ